MEVYVRSTKERPWSFSSQSCILMNVLRNRRIVDNAALVLIGQELMRVMQPRPLRIA